MHRKRMPRLFFWSAAYLFLAAIILGGACSAMAEAAPQIVAQISDKSLVRLKGNTHPLANAANDRGIVSPSLPMRRMLLVLKRPETQEKALAAAIDAMHHAGSPTFHKWLTPAQIGTQYGPAQQDIDKITAWLASGGFTVSSVSKARTAIEFSGTAQSVNAAFHTQIHNYVWQGATYTANAGDPSVPAALAPLVAGFASLNNFPRSFDHSFEKLVQYNRKTKKWSLKQNAPAAKSGAPQFTGNVDGQDVYPITPYDFATIYNVKPLWDAGIDGTGQHIAIVSESNIETSDVDQFRSAFGLPPKNLNVILNGPDPGETIADGAEPIIDVEWAGAVAKNATIDFVVSQTTESTQGVDLSALYIIENQIAPIMSESYGACELALGNAGNLFYYQLWQQAAAQGITAILAAGDSGAATCDQNQPVAQFGDTVSGYASTPYTLTVGGTDFEVSQTNPGKYWNGQNDPTTQASALSYIPEVPWNSSCASPEIFGVYGPTYGDPNEEAFCNDANAQAYLAAAGGGGGASSCATSDPQNPLECLSGYPKPDWQQGVNGIPSDNVRDVPDVSLFAANGAFNSFYLFCQAEDLVSGVCDYSDPDTIVYNGAGGTSFGAPAFAGIMALVNQKTNSSQGLANYVLYNLGKQQYGTPDAPNSSATSACNASADQSNGNSCTYYDVTVGSNAQPCLAGSAGCITNTPTDKVGILPGYTSNAGYDLVTGLGTVNAYNLVNNWAAVNLAGSATTLSVSPATTTYGQPVTISGTVASSSGSGTPTGQVVFQGLQATQGAANLTSGSYSQTTSTLPGGSYSVEATYLGDGSFSQSLSPSVPVTINPAPSSGTLTFSAVDPRSQIVLSTTNQIPYGSQIVGAFTVQGITGVDGILAPTGSVVFNVDGNPATLPLNGNTANFNEIAGAAGSDTWSASYQGDANYQPSPVISGSYTVIQAATTLESHANVSAISGDGNVTLTATVRADSYAAPPMGTVMFYIDGTVVGTANVIPSPDPVTQTWACTASFTIPASLLQPGANALTAFYSGDGNYIPSVSLPSGITYGTGSITSGVTLAASSTTLDGTAPVTLTATVTNGGNPAVVGIVAFLDGSTVLARVPVVGLTPGPNATTGTATLTTQLANGNHSITAVYGGVAGVIPSATSSAVSVAVSGALPTAALISATHNTSVTANYDFTAQLFAGGATAPTGTLSINQTSLTSTLTQLQIDPSTAKTGLAPELTLNAGGTTELVATGDFNGDGIPDLAVTSDLSLSQAENFMIGGIQLTIFLGNGDGTFQAGLPSTVNPDPNLGSPYGIATGDFNADGITDLIFGFNFGGQVVTLLGKGDGTFQTGSTLSIPGGFPVIENFVVDDFNHDGVQDIAFPDLGSSTVDIAFGNGDGSFQQPQTISSIAPRTVLLGDFNHDSNNDLAVLHPFENTVGIMFGNGDGTFQGESTYAVGATPWGMSVGDLNSDGYPDVVTSNQEDGTVAVLINNGDGTFGNASIYSVGAFPQAVAIGDLNHDSIPDVISADNSANTLTILYGKGDGTLQTGQTIPTGQAPLALLLTDLNHDGVTDIVVNENQAGTTGIFLNGTSVTATAKNIAVNGATSEQETIVAAYSGDGNYRAATSAPITLVGSGSQTATQITWSPSATSNVYGTAIAAGALNAQVANSVPGTITYTAQLLGGSASAITGATVLPAAGTYTLTAAFAPTNTTDYAPSTSQITYTVSKADISQALTSSATQADPGAALTFTDVVTSATTGVPTGVVTFFSGANALGAATLDAKGTATITTNTLPAGAASITAVYAGDADFNEGVSSAVNVTVGTATFTLSSQDTAMTLTAGGTGATTVTVTPQAGFTGNVSFACQNLPPGVSCAFAPASGTLGSSPLQTTLTLATTGASSTTGSAAHITLFAVGGGVSLAGLVLVCLPRRMRHQPWVALLVVIAIGGLALGCGDDHHSSTTGPTPPSASTLSLSSSSIKAASGAAVSFTVSLQGTSASSATGTVTFFDGTTQIGQPVSIQQGSAQLAAPGLAVGTHSISAAYSGDSNNLAANAKPIAQVITGTTVIQVVATSGSVAQVSTISLTIQ